MALFQRKPPARGHGPQDFDSVVQLFIDNPGRAFYPEEIVKDVRRRNPSLSARRIEYIRTQLFASGHIRHDAVGGPHKKRYIYTGAKWEPTPTPAQPTHRRPCEPMTLPQWSELKQVLPSFVRHLARCAVADESAFWALHDFLEESGLLALAEHFSIGCVHAKCEALPILGGAMHLAQLELTSKQAAGWLGISVKQFERIVKHSRVEPASDRTAIRQGRVRHTCTWDPEDIARLIDAPEVVAVRPV
jgi:hypothetical protein